MPHNEGEKSSGIPRLPGRRGAKTQTLRLRPLTSPRALASPVPRPSPSPPLPPRRPQPKQTLRPAAAAAPPAKSEEANRPTPMASWHDGLAAPLRVLISPRPLDASAQGNVLSLRHPRSGDETGYLFINDQLQEINWFKERYGAWFLGDYVCEDGGLYYCTPVDPIFIFLPIFEAARMSNGKDPGKYRQLDEILYIEGYPGYQQLMSVAGHHMELVCEVKEVANMKFFRLDDSKVLSWLCCKVHNLKEVFLKLGKNYAAQAEKERLKEAVQMIREYLKDEPWLTLLCKKLQLDLNEIINDVTTKTSEASFYADSSPAPARPSESKEANGSAKSSRGRPAKKPKTEVGSKNIKDMFRRVTRSGSGS
ncbi:hypothetical protein PAHAL_7G189600 [Panicum hallii]|uniref:Ribonuclease H2 subunit B n=2 Tax=Panicum hallii TaxID=206008 RepID=A0A2S3I7M5_9POAL|nr:hypothetical protein PAHAL_7G189600 [Panicum hallii]